MSIQDPNNRHDQQIPPAAATPNQTPDDNQSVDNQSVDQQATSPEGASDSSRRKILIGSQRDAAAQHVRRQRDWEPVVEQPEPVESEAAKPEAANPEPAKPEAVASQAAEGVAPVASESAPSAFRAEDSAEDIDDASGVADTPQLDTELAAIEKEVIDTETALGVDVAGLTSSSAQGHFPAPSARDKLTPEMESEYEAALGDLSMEDLLGSGQSSSGDAMVELEIDSQQTGRVLAVRREDVFVELGSREQGVIAIRQFDDEPPGVGESLEVIVRGFQPEEGLYELSLPNKAADVSGWDEVEDGMLIEVNVTGHNTGGLECEVNQLRGFIPVSQIAMYRVDDVAQFVGEKWVCLVTECNPERRNLVLSRRAVLEREREEARQQMLETLAPGQIHEGVVRKILDFGAFVDLGGVDGLLHISQLGWGRVNHPSDVLTEGQTIKVRVDKIDPETRKIGLSYRDLLENPWNDARKKYPEHSTAKGRVTKLMEFGAFVELEPGVEGLVHISELSHKRVWRPSDVVKEGDEVEVVVLSVDTDKQRIGLSMKQAVAPPEPEKKPEDEEPEALPESKRRRSTSNQPLKGGVGRSSGGDKFGLKW